MTYEGDFKAGYPHGVGKQFENGKLIYNGLVRYGRLIEFERKMVISSKTDNTTYYGLGDIGFFVPENWVKVVEDENVIGFHPNGDEGASVTVRIAKSIDISDSTTRTELKDYFVETYRDEFNSDICEIISDEYRENPLSEYDMRLILYSDETGNIEIYINSFQRADGCNFIITVLGSTKYNYSEEALCIKNTWKKWGSAFVKGEVPETEVQESEETTAFRRKYFSLKNGKMVNCITDGGADGNTLVIKAKIEPNITNELTINQNYNNVADIICNQGGNAYDCIDYWAVADMMDGSEGKVISFTVDKELIDRIYNKEIVDIQFGDYVQDLWILPSLQE